MTEQTIRTATDPLQPGTLRLHGGQLAVRGSRARFRVLVSGRRWGKTTLDLSECMEEFGIPGTVWYIGPTYDMAREVMWDPLLSILPAEWLKTSPNHTRMEIDTIWGCRFACKSAEHPDRLRGRGLRKVICDEFQDWKDGWKTWEEVLMPTLLTTDGKALFTGTPKSFNHLYKAYVKGQKNGTPDWESWQFKTADAPHIPQAYLRQMQSDMDPRAYRQEFEASFENMAGRAYYAFQRSTHVVPCELDPAAPACVCFDFNINPAVVVIGQGFHETVRVVHEVYVEGLGGEATRASAQAAFDWLKSKRWEGQIRVYGDPAGQAGKTTGPSDHAVVREVFRNATWCINPHAPHVKDRVAAVNTRCETMDGQHHFQIDPSCQYLIQDLEQVIFDKNGDLDKKTNEMLTHMSDALGYWVHKEWPVKHVTRAVGRAHIERWL
jgi:hypothetical protein